jgi:hypothetical protein
MLEVHSSAFFLTIVVVQNLPLRMTGSSMATGSDVTEGNHLKKPYEKQMFRKI